MTTEHFQNSTNLTAKILDESISLINNRLGDNYAKKNPNLLSAIVHVQERIYHTLSTKTQN